MRTLALGGVLGPVLFTTVVLVCAALRPGYDHAMQFISELGATGIPLAAWMNFAGFVPSGLLLAGFGLSLATLLPGGRRKVIAAGGVALFGLGITGAGLASCDAGCPHAGSSPEAILHERVSVAAFLGAIGGVGLLASAFRGLPGWRSLWLYSALSSVAAFGLLVAMASSLETRAWTGLWQRLMLGTLFLWCAVVGVRLFRTSARV